MKRKLISLLLVLTMSLASLAIFTACGGDETDGTSFVTDMIGREVQIEAGSYKRVVCIGAGALRMYSYVGDVNLLCGIEDIDNTTRESRPKMFDSAARPYVLANAEVFNSIENSCGVGGPNAQTAEAEKILACNPDIVISEYEDVDKENALQEQLGVPVITLKISSDGVFSRYTKDTITLLGKIFKREKQAKALNKYIEDQTQLLYERTYDIPDEEKKSVYVCGLGNWGTTNHLMTAQNYAPFNCAHIKNAVSGLIKDGIQAIEAEKLVDLGKDIDVMLIDAAAVKNIKPLYKDDPTMFDDVKAWQNGEVYLEMPYNAYYTNLEIALANTFYIAKIVYPERFEDIDITDKLNEITKAFLGKELAEEIYACGASFGGYQKIDTETFFA